MKDQVKEIAATINYGLFLQTLPLIIDFAIQNKRTDITDQLSNLLNSFYSSLSEKEKISFQNQLDSFLRNKWVEFENELKDRLTPKELNQILEEIKKFLIDLPSLKIPVT